MQHIVCVSGGKDSQATYLRAIERGLPFRAVAADTGNENQLTYDAVNMLSVRTGGPEVEWVKADFADRIAAKRVYVAEKWPADLEAGRLGRWERRIRRDLAADNLAALKAFRAKQGPRPAPMPNDVPPLPADPYSAKQRPVERPWGFWVWKSGREPMSPDEAAEMVAQALEFLVPTGNPYLDLCIWKGRFPSRTAQFCTEELKVEPIDRYVTRAALATPGTVISWQGVRAAESYERAQIAPLQRVYSHPDLPGRLYAYRPILRWTTEEVFAYSARFGVPANPLYAAGCSRVGCFPCINASKRELALVDRLFPDQIERLEIWEAHVSKISKRGMATFFAMSNDPVTAQAMAYDVGTGGSGSALNVGGGVRQMIEWAKTDNGGRQWNLFPTISGGDTCSMHGACE